MILSDEQIADFITGNSEDTPVGYVVFITDRERKIAKAQVAQTRQDTLREVESLLSLDMNEMGFVEISNHVDYGDWQAYKDGKHGEMPEQSGTKEKI